MTLYKGNSVQDLTWNNNYTHFSESVGLLQKLISIPSYNEEGVLNAADCLERYLTRLNVQVYRNGANLWVFNKYYDEKYPTILLSGQLDTVQPAEGFTKDPFCPEIANGKLYGLGSTNAGGSLVAMVAAFLQYYHQQHLGFNLCLAASPMLGIHAQENLQPLWQQLSRIHFVITGKPTSMQVYSANNNRSVTANLKVLLNHPIAQTAMILGCRYYEYDAQPDDFKFPYPSIQLGPGDLRRSGTADEFIFLEEIKNGINLYIRLLAHLPLTMVNNPIPVLHEADAVSN